MFLQGPNQPLPYAHGMPLSWHRSLVDFRSTRSPMTRHPTINFGALDHGTDR